MKQSTKKGFTLAEVLITLGVIGVLAALTIPGVVSRSNNGQYVSALKKANSTLSGAVRESKVVNGDMSNWDWGTAVDDVSAFRTYLLPYLDVQADCGVIAEAKTSCFDAPANYTQINPSSTTTVPSIIGAYAVNLADGISIAYIGKDPACAANPEAATICAQIFVDVNGVKGPNMYGRDLFAFDVFPYNVGIKAEGSYQLTDGKYDSTDLPGFPAMGTITCTRDNGSGCAAKVLTEGEMNY